MRIAASLLATVLVMTACRASAQDLQSSPPFYFTGEMTATGINPTPSGQFTALRMSFGVVTPGGYCYWHGTLSANNEPEIDRASEHNARPIPAGFTTLSLDFEAARIARRPKDGGMFLSSRIVSCGRATISDHAHHHTPFFRRSEFDNPAPDFELIVPKNTLRVAAGDRLPSIDLLVRRIGALDAPVRLTAAAKDSRIRSNDSTEWRCFTPSG